MSTEIKVWQLINGHIQAIPDTELASEHAESELENWIVECPDLLGEDLLIIGRQKEVEGVGRLDLLAIHPSGQLVIVELKRSMAPREAVAQALDYASWLDKITEAELLEIAQEYLEQPLDEKFATRFGIKDMPAITPNNHRILLVAPQLDAAAERIINYLAQRHSVNVNAVFFRYTKLPTGQEILARSVLVAESVLQSGSVSRQKPTVPELLAAASVRQVLPLVAAFRSLGEDEKYVSEEAVTTYGGSFRYWRKNIDGKPKMVLGVNVSGQRRDTPAGQLDIWIPTLTLAQVLAISHGEAQDVLKSLPVFEMKTGDTIVRLKNEKEARDAVGKIENWFEKYPGYYKA